MTIQTKPLKEVTEEALAVLNERLGVTNTMRFLAQFTTGQGNYTEEREQLFRDLSFDDIMEGVREMRARKTAEQVAGGESTDSGS